MNTEVEAAPETLPGVDQSNPNLDSAVRIVAAALAGGMPYRETDALLGSVFEKLNEMSGQKPVQAAEPEVVAPVKQKPAVPKSKSITPDAIICLEDGKPCRTLKRYLATRYNLTPQQYREKWDLPADYPMSAPNYSEQRREMAKKIGLGRKAGTTVAKPAKAAARTRKAKEPETAEA